MNPFKNTQLCLQNVIKIHLLNSNTQQKVLQYIEQNKENMIDQDSQSSNSPNQSSQYDSYKPNSAPSCKVKKIRKKHKRQVFRAMKNSKNQSMKPLTQFKSKHPEYFGQSGQQSLQKIRKLIETNYSVQQMLCNQIQSIFHIKEKTQTQKQAASYIKFIRKSYNSTYLKYGIRNKQRQLTYEVFRDQEKLINKKQTLFQTDEYLEPFQSMLNEKRLPIMEQTAAFISKIAEEIFQQTIEIPHIRLQLLALCKLSKSLEKEVVQTITAKISQQDPLLNCHKDREDSRENGIKNKYVQILVINNFNRSFSEEPIDFYNYHKEIESYQKNQFEKGQFERILNFAQFKRYMESRKPMLKRPAGYQLKTACSACFSNYSQMYNPIQKCPECPIRIHKYCQKVDNRCHRCRFSRTSNREKSQTGFCYICTRPRQKGLMIQTVTNQSPHHFAHNFCLLLHNFWRVQAEEIQGSYIRPQQNTQKCAICKKMTGILLVCSRCQNKMHGMCAFLEGCSFNKLGLSQHNAKQYQIELNCCTSPGQRQRLSMQRKFKLCFQKIIFRENEQLFNFIKNQYPE